MSICPNKLACHSYNFKLGDPPDHNEIWLNQMVLGNFKFRPFPYEVNESPEKLAFNSCNLKLGDSIIVTKLGEDVSLMVI